MSLDERRLAGRIRAGDPQAFRDLYDAYGARLLGYALRLAGDQGGGRRPGSGDICSCVCRVREIRGPRQAAELASWNCDQAVA